MKNFFCIILSVIFLTSCGQSKEEAEQKRLIDEGKRYFLKVWTSYKPSAQKTCKFNVLVEYLNEEYFIIIANSRSSGSGYEGISNDIQNEIKTEVNQKLNMLEEKNKLTECKGL